jgi:hypothetical protein
MILALLDSDPLHHTSSLQLQNSQFQPFMALCWLSCSKHIVAERHGVVTRCEIGFPKMKHVHDYKASAKSRINWKLAERDERSRIRKYDRYCRAALLAEYLIFTLLNSMSLIKPSISVPKGVFRIGHGCCAVSLIRKNMVLWQDKGNQLFKIVRLRAHEECEVDRDALCCSKP